MGRMSFHSMIGATCITSNVQVRLTTRYNSKQHVHPIEQMLCCSLNLVDESVQVVLSLLVQT